MKIFEQQQNTNRDFYLPVINAKLYAERFSKETLPILKRSNDPEARQIIEKFKDFVEKIKKFLSWIKDISADMVPYYDEKEMKDLVGALADADKSIEKIKSTSKGYKADKKGKIKKADFMGFLYNSDKFFEEIFGSGE